MQTLITEFGRKRLQQLQNQKKPQDSEPSSPLHGMLTTTASLMRGLTLLAHPTTIAPSSPPHPPSPHTWTADTVSPADGNEERGRHHR